MIPPVVLKQLQGCHDLSPQIRLAPGDRFVIFSDLHLGTGGRNDDFQRNGSFFNKLLQSHYLPGAWNLVLNGDVEELLRHDAQKVRKNYGALYHLFQKFHDQGRFWKIEGNHDPRNKQLSETWKIHSGLKLKFGEDEIFICHGHQGGLLNSGRYNRFVGTFLKVFANALGIKNFSPAYHSASRYKIEERIYRFAANQGIAMVIGHTHRPLFETRSKTSSFVEHFERLWRKWLKSSGIEQRAIERRILFMRDHFQDHLKKAQKDLPSGIYHKEFLVPNLFNSGCGVGKRGITAIEITYNHIKLVHWADPKLHPPSQVQWEYLVSREVMPGLQRTVLRKAALKGIFARIRLFGGGLNSEKDF